MKIPTSQSCEIHNDSFHDEKRKREEMTPVTKWGRENNLIPKDKTKDYRQSSDKT